MVNGVNTLFGHSTRTKLSVGLPSQKNFHLTNKAPKTNFNTVKWSLTFNG